MFRISVKLGDNTALYSDSQVTISQGEIKEVMPTKSIIDALAKGVLIKV